MSSAPPGFLCVGLSVTNHWSEKGLPALGNLFKTWFGLVVFFLFHDLDDFENRFPFTLAQVPNS